MSLPIEGTLRYVADVLRDRIAPALADDFARETNRLVVMMLTIVGNAADDAVALRVAEHAAFRALFADAAGVVDDSDLAAHLEADGRSVDPGLRLSEMDAESNWLRLRLIALQEHLEARDDEPARLLDQRIWRLLRRVEQSRVPRLQT